jgi:toxin ParE1/3/4
VKYIVIWTKLAEQDLNQIIEFMLDKEEVNNAKKIYEKIKSKICLLTENPEQGRLIPELQLLKIKKYREIIINPWRVIYKTDDNKVYILLVIDGRRNLEDILLDRLLRPAQNDSEK